MCLDGSLHVPRQYLRYCKGTGKDSWLISRSTVGAGKEHRGTVRYKWQGTVKYT